MKTATFYTLDDFTTESEQTLLENFVCDTIAAEWQKGKRILVNCEDQQQAERLDELLWQRSPHSFVPHNLVGEGPKQGAPVELCWSNKRSHTQRNLLINLQTAFADFATLFAEVVDFVPNDDSSKQLARERYKNYRTLGFQLTTTKALLPNLDPSK